MKKLLISLMLSTGLFVSAQGSATPTAKFQPLLSGYNVLILSNQVVNVTGTLGVGINSTNVLYTTYAGQILYSLTNNVINGTLYTNSPGADAFRSITLAPDVNGDVNANATLWYMFGNTNYIPISGTNLNGQIVVTNWLLSSSAFPNWQNPATTNLYPGFSNTSTNTVTITLFKEPALRLDGSSTAPPIPFWETTGTFSFVVTFSSSSTMVVGSTNLPATWLQGAKHVSAVVYLPPNMSTNAATAGLLLNQLGILQPQP